MLRADSAACSERGPALRAAAALSLLNPPAWLDTVVLLDAVIVLTMWSIAASLFINQGVIDGT